MVQKSSQRSSLIQKPNHREQVKMQSLIRVKVSLIAALHSEPPRQQQHNETNTIAAGQTQHRKACLNTQHLQSAAPDTQPTIRHFKINPLAFLESFLQLKHKTKLNLLMQMLDLILTCSILYNHMVPDRNNEVSHFPVCDLFC